MRLWAVALLLAAAGSAGAQERPYLFTQSHAGSAQAVAPGHDLAVQLPAHAGTDWSFSPETSRNVVEVSVRDYPSPGRIPDADRLHEITFRLIESGAARIVITAKDLPLPLRPMMPDGVFRLELTPPG
jgi:hypothetical protein